MLWKRLGYLLPWRRRAAEAESTRSCAPLRRWRSRASSGISRSPPRTRARSSAGRELEQAGQDLRYAIRSASEVPGSPPPPSPRWPSASASTLTLFSLINTMLWKSLPVREPATLMVLGRQDASDVEHGFTYSNYQVFREHVAALSVAAYGAAPLNVAIDGRMEPTLQGHLVTGSYFPLLGLAPAAGRLLGPDDDRVPSAHPVRCLEPQLLAAAVRCGPRSVGRADRDQRSPVHDRRRGSARVLWHRGRFGAGPLPPDHDAAGRHADDRRSDRARHDPDIVCGCGCSPRSTPGDPCRARWHSSMPWLVSRRPMAADAQVHEGSRRRARSCWPRRPLACPISDDNSRRRSSSSSALPPSSCSSRARTSAIWCWRARPRAVPSSRCDSHSAPGAGD